MGATGDRIGSSSRLRLLLLGDLATALHTALEMAMCVVTRCVVELTIDERAGQVTEMGHDVASPGTRRTGRGDRVGRAVRGAVV